jgi:hypothetical protein
MFGWFQPTCPCDPAAKAWVEQRLHWLSRTFGLHILLERPIILPTPEYFPDAWDATEEAVRRLFDRVCGYMGVDPDDLEMELFHDRASPHWLQEGPWGGFAAGTWSKDSESPWKKGTVRLELSTLDRPADLVGTMAHELAHQRLLGEGRIDRDTYDNELLTDLTAVFHGFGIFLANNPRKSTGELSYWPKSELRKPEYLSEPMAGYALAHMAWFRDEDRPDWAKWLRWTPRGVFRQGLRYLQKTADSRFRPVRLKGSITEQD